MSLRIGNQLIPTVNVRLSSAGVVNYQEKTINPSTSIQNIIADSGYDALSKVTVNAISTSTKSITSNGTYTPTAGSYFSSVTVNVPTGATVSNQDKTVNPSTSQITVTADSGYTGLGTVTVNAMPAMTLPTTIDSNAASGYTSKAIVSRSTADQYINIPVGYNSSGGYYKISATPNGTLNNPTAAKGTVSNHSITVTPSVTNTAGYIAAGTKTGTGVTVSASELVSGTLSITTNGTKDVTNYASVNVNVPVGATINNQNKTVTPTTSQQVISADSGYTGLGEVTVNAISTQTKSATPSTSAQTITPDSGKYLTSVSISAMPTMTLPTAATASATSGFSSKATIGRSTADQYINIPTGYNSAGVYYKISAVANGSTGTPTATKGTVSGNAITVTPSVTNTTGYITGGTKTGTGVTVNASELVSGNKAITSNGTNIDVTNYATVSVAVPVGSTISNQNKTVTPTENEQEITFDSGYTGLGTVTVEAIDDMYVGSRIIQNSSSSLTVSGATVTAPAGYYASSASKSVATMTLPTAATSSGSGTLKATISRSTSDQYINIPTGYNSTAANYKISAVANGSATTPATTITANPSISINSSGLITATASATKSVTPTVSAGYISSGTAGTITVSGSGTSQLTTKAATTITPTGSAQTAVAKNVYTLGAITVAAVPEETLTATENGTYTPSNGKWFSSVEISVPIGSTISNQNKTVTPTKSQQTITADSGYTGLGTVTVNAIPAAYITTSDANAVAANILSGKTAYVNGSKITGSMANNGATGGTITTQGGTYTIPAGYTSGGTVTANLAAGSTTAANISGTSFEEETGDYGFRTSIQIQPGYYASATTVTKDFSSILPEPESEGTAAQLLIGYDLYDHDGKVISGTMANNSIGTITLDQTTTSYTIPAGYHNGSGKVQHTTVNIPDPTITVNSSGLITASGSWTRGFTTDNSYSKTYQLTTKSSSDLTVSGATVTAPAGYYASAASASVATLTLPTSTASSATSGYTLKATITPSTSDQYINIGTGYNSTTSYYKINAMTTMTLPTSAASSATSGYTAKATIGRSTSAQYINIPPGYNSAGAYYVISAVANGSVTAPSSISGTSATVSTGTNTLTLTKTVSVTPNVTTAGYIASGTAGNASVSLTASVTTKAATTYNVSSSDQTIASGTYLTGTQTFRAVTHTATAAKVAAGQTVTIGDAGSATRIANISGTYTSDATAAAADIASGKTAYVNGSKLTGSLTFINIYTGTSAPSSSTGSNGDIYIQS